MRFIKFNFDKLLNDAVFLIALILIVSQAVITLPAISRLCAGQTISTSADAPEEKTAVISLKIVQNIPYERVIVLVDGKPSGSFFDGKAEVVIGDNSVLEIDGTAVNVPFDAELSVTEGKIYSQLPESVHVSCNIAMAGRVFTAEK